MRLPASLLRLAETGGGEVTAPADEAIGDLDEWLRRAHQARQAGRPGDARAVLLSAAERFPAAAAVRHDLGRLAEAEKDWAEAERWWRAFSAMMPADWGAISHIAHLLRLQGRLAEAEAWVADATKRFPDHPVLFADLARMAETRRDWPQAGERWAAMAAAFPDVWEGPAGQGRVLREQGQIDAARALLTQAAQRFPKSAGPVQELARTAEAQRDWPAAEQYWRTLVTLDAAAWWGVTGLVNALREQGRIAAAEAELTARFDTTAAPWPFIEYARLAERAADWNQAEARWDAVIRRFPNSLDGYSGRARALRERGDRSAARALLAEAAERFPAAALPAHDLARLAEQDQDWAAAEQWWRRFIVLDPRAWWGHLGLAAALRHQGRVEDSEAVLAAQIARPSAEPALFVDYARAAESAADWMLAADRWSAMRARFPAMTDGYLGEARALRQLGRIEDARQLLDDAAARFPRSDAVLHDLGRLAEARRDWTGAEQVWRSLIALDGGPSWGHIGLADALHNQRRFADSSAALTAVFGRLGHEPTVFIHHARLAERSRDWAAAVDRWNEFARRFPRRIEGHTGVVRALAEQGRINEAEVALVSAQSLFSDQASLFEDYARLAESRNDWNEALARWETVRSRFPSIWNAYAKVAWMLILLGRLDEAEAVYRSAPDGIAGPGVLAAALAGLARRQKDPAREEQSWRDALAQASEQWWPVKGLAGSLANQRRFNEARALLRDAALRFPDDPGPPMELARIAETQALFPEAIERWEAGRRRFPGNWEMWTGTAEAHAAAREFDAADDMYHQAQQAFPDLDIILIRWAVFRARHAEVNFTRSGHLIAAVFETYFQQYPETAPLRLAQAQLLRSIDDLDAALKVLAAAGKAFPSEQRIPVEFATVRDLAISLNRDTPLDLAPDLVPADEDAKLFSRFESLGGGGRSEDGWGFGCEFGFVQRNVGLEPLGLLRWASIGPGNLIRALRSGFANVGSEDTTIIREWGAEEWAATDTNFNIIMDHTHLPIAQVPAARARTLVMRKLTFLTRKLLEDLSGGDKIFVYRLLGRAIDAATLDDLAAAIRAYGNNTLLFVAYADAAHPSGSVERVREGLLVGYIDWFAPDRDNLPCNLSGWRSVCAAALRVIAA